MHLFLFLVICIAIAVVAASLYKKQCVQFGNTLHKFSNYVVVRFTDCDHTGAALTINVCIVLRQSFGHDCGDGIESLTVIQMNQWHIRYKANKKVFKGSCYSRTKCQANDSLLWNGNLSKKQINISKQLLQHGYKLYVTNKSFYKPCMLFFAHLLRVSFFPLIAWLHLWCMSILAPNFYSCKKMYNYYHGICCRMNKMCLIISLQMCAHVLVCVPALAKATGM